MKRTPRKQRLQWMEARLRRLHYKKQPTERQARRAFELRQAIEVARRKLKAILRIKQKLNAPHEPCGTETVKQSGASTK